MQISYEIPKDRREEYEVFDRIAEGMNKPTGLVEKLEQAINKLPDGWIKADKIIVEYFGVPAFNEKDQKVRISPGGDKFSMCLPSEVPSHITMDVEDGNPNAVTFINFQYDGTKYVVASRRNTSLVDSPNTR